MKIGIATFQWNYNYGAVLQAVALQSFLEARGHTVEIIDFRISREVASLRKWIGRTPAHTLDKWCLNWQRREFDRFRTKHLHRTPETFYNAHDLGSLKNRYDVLITGSDQVWNPRWLDQVHGLEDLFLLSFANEHTTMISYAASFGHADSSTISLSWQSILGRQLQKFSAVGVRESSGVGIVEALAGRNDAIHTPDPVLLHRCEFYEDLMPSRSRTEPILFSYMLHGREQDAEPIIEVLTAQRNLTVLRYTRRKSMFKPRYIHPTPEMWLRKICDARVVVTNSFHAIAFCLIFKTPFIAIGMDGELQGMNIRLKDLLNMVGLGERMISAAEPPEHYLLEQEISWDNVETVLANLRSKAACFFADNGL